MKTPKPTMYEMPIFKDLRGSFQELFLKKKINLNFKFSAVSFSKKNVIRGLHFQIKKPQIKLVTVLKGKIIDYCINLRKNSDDFGKVYRFVLTPGKILLIPKFYAHGMGCLEKRNIFFYHLSEYRHPQYEMGIKYDDSDLKLKWNIKKPIISKRDLNHISLKEFKKRFKGI
tara:strand:+ start:53 stop:565 length:513 start_codon:yes stop_codon:yes gene_type:complete